MAFRGRGQRGRGRGGNYDRIAKHVPFELFPKDVNLPPKPGEQLTKEEKALIYRKLRLEHFWRGSCYNLQEAMQKTKKEDEDIDWFRDKPKINKEGKREALTSYLKMTTSNFPSELVQGSRKAPVQKNLRWGRDSDNLLDYFEKLEESAKGLDGNGSKEMKGESEDEEEAEEEVEEESDDGDYNQNIDFDDDEDDLNMVEDEAEDCY